MRALVGSMLACSGCLVSEPEGAAQFWPPTLGLTVESVVAGDLDANGSTEVVVLGSGSTSQEGMYVIEGGTDFDFGTATPVRSFSRFIPVRWTPPLAAFYSPGAAPRVHVASSEAMVTVRTLSNTLAELEQGESMIAGGGPLLWTRPVLFPGGMQHVAVSNGSTIEHMNADLGMPRPIPAQGSPTWDSAQLVTSYASGSAQIVVVAMADEIVRGTIPTMPGTPFQYETVRSGPRWSGQTTHDFDGDGREEIIGFDVQAHEVCVVDPGAATIPVTPSCVKLLSTFPGTDVTLLVGQNLSQNPGLDILVAQATGSETAYSLVEDYTYNAGTLSAMMTRMFPVAGPPRGRTVLVTAAPGAPHVVLTFGTDGAVACVLGPC